MVVQRALSIAADGVDITREKAKAEGESILVARVTITNDGYPVVRLYLPAAIIPTLTALLGRVVEDEAKPTDESYPTPSPVYMVVQLFSPPAGEPELVRMSD